MIFGALAHADNIACRITLHFEVLRFVITFTRVPCKVTGHNLARETYHGTAILYVVVGLANESCDTYMHHSHAICHSKTLYFVLTIKC